MPKALSCLCYSTCTGVRCQPYIRPPAQATTVRRSLALASAVSPFRKVARDPSGTKTEVGGKAFRPSPLPRRRRPAGQERSAMQFFAPPAVVDGDGVAGIRDVF